MVCGFGFGVYTCSKLKGEHVVVLNKRLDRNLLFLSLDCCRLKTM